MNVKPYLLSLSLVVSPVVEAQAEEMDTITPQTNNLETLAAQVTPEMQELFCSRQYTILGDTNHDAPEIPSFISTDAVFDAMEACNIQHIFLEKDQSSQSIFDSLTSGDIDVDEFVTQMQNAGLGSRGEEVLRADAQIALEAEERGITIYAAQMETGAAEITEIMLYTEMGFRSYAHMLPEDMKDDFESRVFDGEDLSEERWDEIMQYLFDNQDDPSFQTAQDMFAQADAVKTKMEENGIRREDDRLLYDFTEARVPEGERAMILIGDGHPSEPVIGIYDRLGEERASWVSLYADIGKYDTEQENQPDYVIDLENSIAFTPK